MPYSSSTYKRHNLINAKHTSYVYKYFIFPKTFRLTRRMRDFVFKSIALERSLATNWPNYRGNEELFRHYRSIFNVAIRVIGWFYFWRASARQLFPILSQNGKTENVYEIFIVLILQQANHIAFYIISID